MILDRIGLRAAVGHALLARVRPGERRLDAVARVVGEGQADRAGGRDRQQVRVAQALRAHLVLQRGRQARGERAARQVEVGVEQRERAALQREIGRRVVGGVAHRLRDALRLVARGGRVVAQVQHHQRVAQPGEAEPDAPLRVRLGELGRQRPHGDVQHVVQHARRGLRDGGEGVVVEARVRLERIAHEVGQVDGAEAAAAVGRQRLFAAIRHHEAVGVEGVDLFDRDVEDRFFADRRQRFEGGSEASAGSHHAHPRQQNFHVRRLRLADESDALGEAPCIAVRNDDLRGLRVGDDHARNAKAQEHALQRLQIRPAIAREVDARAGCVDPAVGTEHHLQQTGTACERMRFDVRVDERLHQAELARRSGQLDDRVADRYAIGVIDVGPTPIDGTVVVQHERVPRPQLRGGDPFIMLDTGASHLVIGRQLQRMAFAGSQHEHRLHARLEEAFGLRAVRPAVDDRHERLPDQLGHLPRAFAGLHPRIRRHARIRRRNRLAITQVVVLVDAVEEQHARLGVVVGAAHDLVPQRAGARLAVDPDAVVALLRAGLDLLLAGLGAVHEVERRVVVDGLHERVGDAHRDVEVGEVALVLGVDEGLDVGVVAA